MVAGSYVLSFSLAGGQRGTTEDTQISVLTGVVAPYIITLGSSSPFTTYTVGFTLGSAQSVNIVFSDTGAADLQGALLDNVVLSTAGVPDGGTTAMLLGMGMMALAAFRLKFNWVTA